MKKNLDEPKQLDGVVLWEMRRKLPVVHGERKFHISNYIVS